MASSTDHATSNEQPFFLLKEFTITLASFSPIEPAPLPSTLFRPAECQNEPGPREYAFPSAYALSVCTFLAYGPLVYALSAYTFLACAPSAFCRPDTDKDLVCKCTTDIHSRGLHPRGLRRRGSETGRTSRGPTLNARTSKRFTTKGTETEHTPFQRASFWRS